MMMCKLCNDIELFALKALWESDVHRQPHCESVYGAEECKDAADAALIVSSRFSIATERSPTPLSFSLAFSFATRVNRTTSRYIYGTRHRQRGNCEKEWREERTIPIVEEKEESKTGIARLHLFFLFFWLYPTLRCQTTVFVLFIFSTHTFAKFQNIY